MKYYAFLVSCIFLPKLGAAGKLPSTFPVCKRSDSDLNKCLKEAIEVCLPQLKNEIPELGLPSIDPMHIERLSFEADSGSTSIKLTFRNVQLYNLVHSKITKAEVILDKQVKMVVHVYAPTLHIDTDYDVDGKILALPIIASGNSTIDFEGMQAVVTMEGEYVQRKGKTFAKLNHLEFEGTPIGIVMHIDNLFNGNEQLEVEMNRLMNENALEMYEDYRKPLQEAIAQFLRKIFEAVLKRVPVDELYPAD